MNIPDRHVLNVQKSISTGELNKKKGLGFNNDKVDHDYISKWGAKHFLNWLNISKKFGFVLHYLWCQNQNLKRFQPINSIHVYYKLIFCTFYLHNSQPLIHIILDALVQYQLHSEILLNTLYGQRFVDLSSLRLHVFFEHPVPDLVPCAVIITSTLLGLVFIQLQER